MNANWGIINTDNYGKDKLKVAENALNEIKSYLKEKKNGTI